MHPVLPANHLFCAGTNTGHGSLGAGAGALSWSSTARKEPQLQRRLQKNLSKMGIFEMATQLSATTPAYLTVSAHCTLSHLPVCAFVERSLNEHLSPSLPATFTLFFSPFAVPLLQPSFRIQAYRRQHRRRSTCFHSEAIAIRGPTSSVSSRRAAGLTV